MSLVNATFLVNDLTQSEHYVENLPADYIFGAGERLVIRQITAQEKALLTGEKYKNIKMYRYVDQDLIVNKNKPPKGIDYKVGLNTRLFEEAYINDIGFLERMDFYGSASYNTVLGAWEYSDKVVTESYMYTIDPKTKYVVARTKIITWFKEDNTAHPDKKIMFKPYTFIEMEEEALRRRSNIIAQLKIELAKFGNWVMTQQYPDASQRPDSNEVVKQIAAPFNTGLRNYIDAGDKSVVKLIQDTQEPFFSLTIPWFGKTVRQFAIDRIK